MSDFDTIINEYCARILAQTLAETVDSSTVKGAVTRAVETRVLSAVGVDAAERPVTLVIRTADNSAIVTTIPSLKLGADGTVTLTVPSISEISRSIGRYRDEFLRRELSVVRPDGTCMVPATGVDLERWASDHKLNYELARRLAAKTMSHWPSHSTKWPIQASRSGTPSSGRQVPPCAACLLSRRVNSHLRGLQPAPGENLLSVV